MTALLKTIGLRKAFGGLQAIDAVDLTVDCREILGIIGPNGAGKSTLINLITGSSRPDAGKIEFDGKDITAIPSNEAARCGIARTFQLVRPFANISLLDNVVVGRLYGSKPARTMKQARSEAEDLLDFVGLNDKRHVRAGNLTLAERRKLELARALAVRPRLLFLDEVIAGLNPVETETAIQVIRKVQALGIAIAFVEHVMKAVVELSTRVIVLDAGRKIAEGYPQEVMSNPLVVQSYLGEEA
jgi:branched-chain amino acid transport system ATP-binding protein